MSGARAKLLYRSTKCWKPGNRTASWIRSGGGLTSTPAPSEQPSIQYDLLHQALGLEQFLIPSHGEGGRLSRGAAGLQSLVDFAHAIGRSEAGLKTQGIPDLVEADVIVALIGVVGHHLHVDGEGDVFAHDVGEVENLR